MPTGPELDLFTQCSGGSGDARQDELVAKNLGNFINVPEKQVMSFIRTRDRLTVHKLSKVLKDMPDSQFGTSSAGGSKRSTIGRAQSHGSAQFTNRVFARARLQDIGSHHYGSSSYGDQFGSMEGGPPTKPAVAFERIIRPTYKNEFERWRTGANDQDVKVLADACRALKYFNSGSQAATTYNGFHKSFPGHHPKTPPQRTNAANKSAVPLGSIYSQSEREIQARRDREEQEADCIRNAVRVQSAWCQGTDSYKEEALKMNTAVFAEIPGATVHKNFQATPYKIPKSVNRETWTNDVHSKIQTKRHDHKWVNPGETDWAMCGLTGHTIADSLYALRDPKLFPDGGPPSLKRIVGVKLARTDHLSRAQSAPSVSC